MLSPSLALPIIPISHRLSASITVPGSKSLTNRALLLAALATGETTLTNALASDDTHHFIESLQHLGFSVTSVAPDTLKILGLGGHIPATSAQLYVGNAGTAARFITPLLALGQGEYILDGDARMRERPIGDLIQALTRLGAHIEPISNLQSSLTTYHLPLRLTSSGLPGGHTTVAGNISSQFLSGLLMVAPYARAALEIEVTGELNSKPYVDMTLAIMRDFGVTVEHDGYQRFCVAPQVYRSPGPYAIESDASAAAYFFAAPAICGGSVRVENVSRHSKQGDIAFLDILSQMGCTITENPTLSINNQQSTISNLQLPIANYSSITVTASPHLRGLDIDMRDIPDTAQTLAALAPFASSPTTIRGIASARVKETDRVAATCAELHRLGVAVEEYPDGMKIYPCANIHPATIHTYNDHRMAMAFALIGLRVPGVVIENPACVSKTFPTYFEVLETLRD